MGGGISRFSLLKRKKLQQLDNAPSTQSQTSNSVIPDEANDGFLETNNESDVVHTVQLQQILQVVASEENITSYEANVIRSPQQQPLNAYFAPEQQALINLNVIVSPAVNNVSRPTASPSASSTRNSTDNIVTPLKFSPKALMSLTEANYVPYTPTGNEALIYPYYCPLCMLHFKGILKTGCCGHYICDICYREYLKSKDIINYNHDDGDQRHQPLASIPCPNCSQTGFFTAVVRADESIRDYSRNVLSFDEANGHKLTKYDYSPVRIGESFDDLKRKIIPYQQQSSKNTHNIINIDSHDLNPRDSTINGIAVDDSNLISNRTEQLIHDEDEKPEVDEDSIVSPRLVPPENNNVIHANEEYEDSCEELQMEKISPNVPTTNNTIASNYITDIIREATELKHSSMRIEAT